MLLQIDPSTIKVPGALDSLLQTSAIFAIMAVIVVAVTYAGWKILNKHLAHLEREADKTKVLGDMSDDLRSVKEKLNRLNEELIRGGHKQ